MDNAVVLHTGYLPKRVRENEAMITTHSMPEDVVRIGPDATLRQVRAALQFCSMKPIDSHSRGRTAAINMDGMNPNTQNALLHMLEEPPPETLFVLTTQDTANVLDTILSRCDVRAYLPESFGDSVKDLEGAGMNIKRAAVVASSLTRGYSV